ncbi:MAG: hypothetical protein HY927_08885 [Elusimicrobia bacterium]|nr:hypothetical protein [Elusimicrobiota bacterium]
MKSRLAWSLLAAFVFCAGTETRTLRAAETETEPAVAKAKPRPKKPARPKKKGYDYEKSKYKSDALIGSEPRIYKFDAKGRPVSAPSAGRSARKKGKPGSSEEESSAATEPEGKREAREPTEPAGGKAGVKKPASIAEEEYVCSMGDYRGPMTKDGKCPKCGMALQKAQ